MHGLLLLLYHSCMHAITRMHWRAACHQPLVGLHYRECECTLQSCAEQQMQCCGQLADRFM
jgi:hypothetical protein